MTHSHHRYVVTGGAGFIGSHLVDALSRLGEVAVVDDLSAGSMSNLAGTEVDLYRGSVCYPGLLNEAFRGADTVFHLAAVASVQRSVEDPVKVNEVNLAGTLNVLVAARDAGAGKVVYASSAAVYGSSPVLPKREDMVPEPGSPYAVTKLAGEGYCRAFREVYGLETASLRFFNVFGPRQDPSSEYSGVISRFVDAALRGKEPVIYGDGEQTRDFVYVKDVVRACILATRPGVFGEYNVACGERISLNRLVEVLGEISGGDIRTVYAPARSGDIRHSLADVEKARTVGWEARTGIKEGIRRLMEAGLSTS